MLFNSFEFFLFAIAFFAFWPLARAGGNNIRWAFLSVFSIFFYGWWDFRYILLLLLVKLTNFAGGWAIGACPRHRKLMFGLSIAFNLAILGFHKYLDFAIANINAVLGLAGVQPLPLQHILLPVGISFFVFQAMSYTIDVYRGLIKPTKSFLHFLAFVSLFPQLMAGPIVRAADLLPQLESYSIPTAQQRWDGLRLIVHGYFKKVVIADRLAPVINGAFGLVDLPSSGSYWWAIMMMFSMQIYCDFSGYSDIARGLAKWMGYEFLLNFNHPYASSSIREFWTRWHISLSTWFRDYVYFPLGGSRKGELNGHRNMWITMLLSALWHGANWTFIVWGALHALYLSLERLTDWPRRLGGVRGGRFLSMAVVFVLVLIAWVFFRATSFAQAWGILSAMLNPMRFDLSYLRSNVPTGAMTLVALMVCRELYFFFGFNGSKLMQSRPATAFQPAVVAAMIVACVFLRGPGGAFIYFQF